MFGRLFKKMRQNDGQKQSFGRTDRFFCSDGQWFFKTREGHKVGPFLSRSDAQHALLFFIERNEWPDETDLRDFIEGCKLYASGLN